MRSQHHLWVMRLVACALLSGCAARVDDTLNLLNTCPYGPDACLEMDLGLANLADERLIGQELLPGGRLVIDIMRGEFTQPYQGYDIPTSWQRRTLIKYSLTFDARQNLFSARAISAWHLKTTIGSGGSNLRTVPPRRTGRRVAM